MWVGSRRKDERNNGGGSDSPARKNNGGGGGENLKYGTFSHGGVSCKVISHPSGNSICLSFLFS